MLEIKYYWRRGKTSKCFKKLINFKIVPSNLKLPKRVNNNQEKV